MNAIDRVMSAYSRTHPLNAAETLRVRAELSAFIEELRLGRFGTPEPPVWSTRPGGE
jgi:hypothetical protein